MFSSAAAMFRLVELSVGIFVALYVLTINAVFVSYGVCNTPFGLQGHCVPLSDCPTLYGLVTGKNLNNQIIQFLRQSYCGFDTNATLGQDKTRVCCLDNPNAENLEGDSGKLLPSKGVCGITFNTRIFGGVDTELGEYPWSALIKYQRPYNAMALNCAGVLINRRYVLSAAHCLRNPNIPTSWKLDSVRLGEWNISSNPDCIQTADGHSRCSDPYVEVKIERIIIHEKYIPHSRSEFYDIALIRMAENVNYSDMIRPICLPSTNELRQMTFENEYADVAGWGRTEVSSYSTVKKKISLIIWHTDACEAQFKKNNIPVNQTLQLCAGGQAKQDTCQGDSGAPLTMRGRDMNAPYFVVGIVSFGMQPCGLESWPGIYTRVTHYIDWIMQNLED